MHSANLKTFGIFLSVFLLVFTALKVSADTTISIGDGTQTVSHLNPSIPTTDTSIYAGDTVTMTFPTTLKTTGKDGSGNECTASATDYVWSIKSVSYSKDGMTFNTDSYMPSISGDATGTMTAAFPIDVNHPAGFWQVVVHVHVDYTSNCGDNSAGADSGSYGLSVAKGDFGISAAFIDPNSSEIPQGGRSKASVTITPLAGFNGTVTISSACKVAISGAGGNTDSPLFPNSDTFLYSVSVGPDVPPGTYPLEIIGTYSILSHFASLSVTVFQRPVDISSKWDHTFHRGGGPPGSQPHDTAGVQVSNDAKTPHAPVVADAAADWNSGYWQVLGGAFNAKPTDYKSYVWNFNGSSTHNITSSVSSTSTSSYDAEFDAGNIKTGPKGSTIINVTAITPEGASTSNSYTIMWHAPYEMWTPNAQNPSFSSYQEIDPDDTTTYAVAGGSQNWTFHFNNTYESEFVSTASAMTASVLSNYSPLSAIGSLLAETAIVIDTNKTTVPSQGKEFSYNLWQSALNGTAPDARFQGTPPTSAQLAADPTLWQTYHMKAVMRVDFVTNRYNAAHYNATGFDRDFPQAITKYDGHQLMIGIIYQDKLTQPGG